MSDVDERGDLNVGLEMTTPTNCKLYGGFLVRGAVESLEK